MRAFSYARGHLRSHDKDGGHTIRFAVAKTPMLQKNALCFIEPEVFTALHEMQTRSCDENSVSPSVCLSVRPSVRQMREL